MELVAEILAAFWGREPGRDYGGDAEDAEIRGVMIMPAARPGL